MPQRTKKQKIRASLRQESVKKPLQNNLSVGEGNLHGYFRGDMIKSLTIILAIIALEIILYYGTMNNHLSFIVKLGK